MSGMCQMMDQMTMIVTQHLHYAGNLQTVMDRATDGADIYVTSNYSLIGFCYQTSNL